MGAGRLRAAAQATLEAVKRSVDTSPRAFELVDIKPVKVFDEAAVIVAVAVGYDGKVRHMVGFCVIDDENPPSRLECNQPFSRGRSGRQDYLAEIKLAVSLGSDLP